MDVVSQQCIITENLKGVTTAGGALVLQSNPRKGGGVLNFDIVSCRAAGANTVVTIEFVKAGAVYGLRTLTLGTANFWYKTRGPVHIPSDFTVRLTFSAGGDSNICEASVYGCEVRPE